ncbi:hypothetical protein C8R44DRAFT_984771 [Mycena epipterygia]|nr:hypothetical protein C8R44DRAFT_984771 [Mycena epipterygia]
MAFWPEAKARTSLAITGLGGKGALAVVVMRHIRVVLDFPDATHIVALLADCLSMLGYRCISDPSLRDAVFQEGVVHILPSVVYTLASPPFDDSGETLWNLCFSGSTHALLRYMLSGHECVAQCLSDGFLRALLECERRLHIDEVNDFVGNVFSLLSLSLVYYSVAVQLEIALNELGLRAVEDAFCGIPDLSIRWELFFTLAQQRLSLLNAYRDGHLSTTYATIWRSGSTYKATIALKIVQFLRRRPGTIPVIIFNYAEPLLEYKITVTVPTEKRGVPKDYLSRAERSNGRILLRVMKFMEGPNIHRWIFPLHMETSELLVGLQLIAQEDGDDLDETTARIEDLLDLDVEETL